MLRMKPFESVKSPVAALMLDNIDTDIIIPKQFLKTIKRTGLGKHAFNDMRYLANGSNNPDFVLNKPPYTEAKILLSGKNFGCGSSREHAPWAILDQGIQCILAESFADIFFNNCSKNGLLLIQLPEETLKDIQEKTSNASALTVNLEEQKLSTETESWRFDIEPERKERLLLGLDDIKMTEEHTDAIAAYEEKQNSEKPWL